MRGDVWRQLTELQVGFEVALDGARTQAFEVFEVDEDGVFG